MKLYTENQVISALNKVFIESITFEDVNEVMTGLTPIELPSDEEIGKLRDEHIPIDEENMWSERFYFTIGAKWMRDKIQGGINE